jgi:hypothetical protein
MRRRPLFAGRKRRASDRAWRLGCRTPRVAGRREGRQRCSGRSLRTRTHRARTHHESLRAGICSPGAAAPRKKSGARGRSECAQLRDAGAPLTNKMRGAQDIGGAFSRRPPAEEQRPSPRTHEPGGSPRALRPITVEFHLSRIYRKSASAAQRAPATTEEGWRWLVAKRRRGFRFRGRHLPSEKPCYSPSSTCPGQGPAASGRRSPEPGRPRKR